MRIQPIKKILANLSLVLSSILISLIVAEIAVRLFFPQQLVLIRPDIWMPDDKLGWRRASNLDTTVNTGERTVQLLTDEDGYRIGRERVSDPELRLLVLGDSLTAALQVNHEQSVAGLLERDLSRDLNKRVQVVNTAVGGWGPSHYLIKAKEELAETHYDGVVLFFYIGNDVEKKRRDRIPPKSSFLEHRLRFPRKLSLNEFVDGIFYPINDFLETGSHLYVLIKNRAWFLLMKLGLSARYFPDVLLTNEASSDRWSVCAEVLCDVKAVADEHRLPLLVVMIPEACQVDQRLAYNYAKALNIPETSIDLDQPSRLLSERFDACDLDVLDTLGAFRAALSAGTGGLFGKVDTHLGPGGHELLTQLVRPKVVELLKEKR